ncbi:hypothetical protein NM208_g839 [Fusarium decemcellulare]|uniref:Uncharacterized protein n=1 Tax=Fusarium decemcellulare TaxID=57161 RepID=A0ACC1SYB0_9HYPO|nr:hypothetical protein NM208_g839 [Fusarium decemcellulare]
MSEPTATRSAELGGVANLIGRLSITDDPPVLKHIHANDSALTEAILDFNRIAAVTRSQGDDVIASTSDAHIADGGVLDKICSLRKRANELVDAAKTLRDATEESIVQRLAVLGGQRESRTKRLMPYFKEPIKAIVRSVLDESNDEASALWKIVEECYNEAVRPSGTLKCANYYDSLRGLARPYALGFVREKLHAHENRRIVDEDYAEDGRRIPRENMQRKTRAREQEKQVWINFWVRALSRCPDGPTLFYPPAASDVAQSVDWPFQNVARYLFRAFDRKSSGTNDDDVVASTMSKSERGSDILSLTTHDAAKMLLGHLNKGPFNGLARDNLMSWSSSLMFVIQYAIWRSHVGNLPPSEVRICAIDTTKFPNGQFVRDMALLKAYQDTVLNEGQKSFLRFRLGRADYDNGEYLSQGLVNHGGRSSTFSLQDLVDAGLYELYPELEDAESRQYWTNRVKSLRRSWDTEQETTTQEIRQAFGIAERCVQSSDVPDIALLLLSFKNRKHQSTGRTKCLSMTT